MTKKKKFQTLQDYKDAGYHVVYTSQIHDDPKKYQGNELRIWYLLEDKWDYYWDFQNQHNTCSPIGNLSLVEVDSELNGEVIWYE